MAGGTIELLNSTHSARSLWFSMFRVSRCLLLHGRVMTCVAQQNTCASMIQSSTSTGADARISVQHRRIPISTPAMQSRSLCTEPDHEISFHLQDYDDFKERVLDSDHPVVVQFHARWCGPCKMLSPRLESLVNSRGGELLLAKADVDECDFALDYGVAAVPTVIAFVDGEQVAQFTGMRTDDEINAFLDEVVEK